MGETVQSTDKGGEVTFAWTGNLLAHFLLVIIRIGGRGVRGSTTFSLYTSGNVATFQVPFFKNTHTQNKEVNRGELAFPAPCVGFL